MAKKTFIYRYVVRLDQEESNDIVVAETLSNYLVSNGIVVTGQYDGESKRTHIVS